MGELAQINKGGVEMKPQTLEQVAREILFTIEHREGLRYRKDLISDCERMKLAWALGDGPCPNTVYHFNVAEGCEPTGNCDICGC